MVSSERGPAEPRSIRRKRDRDRRHAILANGVREPAPRRPDSGKPTLPLAILIFADKDATAEFDMISHAPAVIGTLGDGGEDDDDEEDDSSEGGYTMEEVAKHNKKGELAIMTFAGKGRYNRVRHDPPS